MSRSRALQVGNQLQRKGDYHRAVERAFAIFQERNAKYGDSFVNGGLMGIAGEISGVGRRLEKFLLQDPPLFAEEASGSKLLDFEEWEPALLNCLIDAANYAVMGLILMEYRLYHGNHSNVSESEDTANPWLAGDLKE